VSPCRSTAQAPSTSQWSLLGRPHPRTAESQSVLEQYSLVTREKYWLAWPWSKLGQFLQKCLFLRILSLCHVQLYCLCFSLVACNASST
jgi:hypothetical protein